MNMIDSTNLRSIEIEHVCLQFQMKTVSKKQIAVILYYKSINNTIYNVVF